MKLCELLSSDADHLRPPISGRCKMQVDRLNSWVVRGGLILTTREGLSFGALQRWTDDRKYT